MKLHPCKVFLLASFLIFAIIGCGSDGDDDQAVTPASTWKVTYEVIAEDSYDWNTIYGIEYTDETGSEVWVDNSPQSPWTYEFTTDRSDFPLYIRALPMPCDGPCIDFTASVTVNVYVDGELVGSQTDPAEAVIDDALEHILADSADEEPAAGEENSGDTPASTWSVKYEVIAEDSYDWNTIYGIEYADETGSEVWIDNSPQSPWTYEFTTDRSDFPLYIRALPMPCDGPCIDFTASVTVNVYVNGELVGSQTDPTEAVIDDSLLNLTRS